MTKPTDDLDELVRQIRALPDRDRLPAIDVIRSIVAAATRRPPQPRPRRLVTPPPSPQWIHARDIEF